MTTNLYNYAVIGDSDVGKTTILYKLTHNTVPNDDYLSTIGIDFYCKTISVDDVAYILHIWDTSGQERYTSIIKPYLRKVKGYIIVYDMSNQELFKI